VYLPGAGYWVVLQKVQGGLLRFAGVNDHGYVTLHGALELGCKRLLLHSAGAVIVIEVQPDFAPGEHFGMLQESF
jgi:hypothetical protein